MDVQMNVKVKYSDTCSLKVAWCICDEDHKNLFVLMFWSYLW